MILIVIVILMLVGLAPLGLDERLGSPGGCGDPGALLIVEQGSDVIAIDPLTVAARIVPVGPDAVRIAERGWRVLRGAVPAPWRVLRASDATAQRIEVYEQATGDRVFGVAFPRRIELSTAAVSPSGRFTVHVQANNVASEITVLDAGRGMQWRREIPHNARLAAYAIGVAFSPNGACAALSMERDGGEGPETWLLDLESGDVSDPPLANVFVLGWGWRQV